MLPEAHKTNSVEIIARDNARTLRGPEARALRRLYLLSDQSVSGEEIGQVRWYSQEGEKTFPLLGDGSLLLPSGAALPLLGLGDWLGLVERGEDPTWPPQSQS